jgi:hypothetical protein
MTLPPTWALWIVFLAAMILAAGFKRWRREP